MIRLMLTDELWSKLRTIMRQHGIYDKPNLRMIADKGYDSEELRALVRSKLSIPVIPRKSNSKTGNDDMDW